MDLQGNIQRWAQQMGIGDDDLPEVLSGLAIQAIQQYRQFGKESDLEVAVECGRGSIRSVGSGGMPFHDRAFNFAGILVQRYERRGYLADLDEAITVINLSMASTPDPGEDRALRLDLLGVLLETQYGRTGRIADLEEAARLAREAVDLMPAGDRRRAGFLRNLSAKLRKMFVQTRDRTQLDESVVAARQALEAMPPGTPNRGNVLNNLALILMARYEETSQATDLEEAIAAAREAVDSSPVGQSERLHGLNSLAALLGFRFERTADVTDVNEAIEIARQAVALAPLDHPKRPCYLDNVGTKLGRRYEHTGQVADLDEAVRLIREAVQTGADDPDQVIWVNNLGNILFDRYERTSEMADLEEAIRLARRAVNLTPESHVDRAGWLNNLGTKLEVRYKRTRQLPDLEEAIDVAREAVELTPPGHNDRAAWLTNLANKLEMRFHHTGQAGDLEEAIRMAREAVDLTPENHYDQTGRLTNLANKMHTRYRQSRESVHLEQAIELANRSVGLTPEDNPNLAPRLHQLSSLLEDRFRLGGPGAAVDLVTASQHLMRAWQCQTAIPIHRVQAVARCIKLLAGQGAVPAAIQLGKEAIDFLPAVNTKSLDRNDQQFVVSTFGGVAADVCTFLLAANRPLEALEYLEKGRAVIIGQLVDARGDISTLLEQCPDLARRYERLREEVNAPVGGGSEQSAFWSRMAGRRREAAAELEACIQEIRGVPGNERFLLGQTVTEMQQCAAGGTIVIVNITRFRSHAILVSADGVRALNLPWLLAQDAETWLSKKWTGRGVRRADRAVRNREFLEYLAWLWNVCVEPVLTEVFGAQNAADSQPRIWWVGTGLGSSMPFHAAGVHSAGSRETAFAKVVSSYTPSIKALGHSQRRARATEAAEGSLLVVTMPTTPGQALRPELASPAPLSGADDEKSEITAIVDRRMAVEHLDLPSVGDVVGRLRDCSIAHFACHGSTDHADPSNSGLLLQKPAAGRGPEQDRLTVRRISELSLASARIAYLSACSTAENEAEWLSDEVIHVVSGFQVAGFPHVVGCLWPSVDDVCVKVAGEFYRLLLRPGATGRDRGAVAAAIQGAVLKLRDEFMDVPLFWAQFVHYGA